MRILYPFNPINAREADGPFQAEYRAAKQAGIACSLFDFDAFDSFRPKPTFAPGEQLLYRGWMLRPERYAQLVMQVESKGATMLTSPEQYRRCHHLPGWYAQCQAFSAETHFYPDNDALDSQITALGWDRFFVKDYVKSNNTARGSIARNSAEVREIVELIRQYRGGIEGGIAIRRVEAYRPETEVRYFVAHGQPFGPQGNAPPIVSAIAAAIDAPFFSADIIQTSAGEHRLVEIGDGQVSDRKTWSVDALINVLIRLNR